jgi:mannose-6-phosphate isomerase
LNTHKKYVLKYIDWYIEANDAGKLVLIPWDTYNIILSEIAQNPLRLQPIYIPRVWGGKYIIKVRNLPLKACAFSMEVYVPIQNIRISLGDIVIKIPFLNILWNQPTEILGNETISKFGEYFPLTANYDDTYKGGSLAIQVHPNGKYMREKFNEKISHDETYYAVKVWPGAKTYLGLKEETELEELRDLSSKSEKQKIPLEQDNFINSFKSTVGDLFLIPSGTVHASGANQLILELDMDGSKVGAEYTFHIYDYLRLDLEGKLRSIHLDHAFSVIRPFVRTNWVKKYLKQEPRLLRKGQDWAEYVLGERKGMFYQVQRLDFQNKVADNTNGRFHILTLVEGESVVVGSDKFPERKYVFNHTETVVIPACLGSYSIKNLGNSFCKITKSFIK